MSPNERAIETLRWEADERARERELSIKEREVLLKEKEQLRSRWTNPLVIAVFAATLAATGNAIVALINGWSGRILEDSKSQTTLILEMIRTNDHAEAKTNLKFLVEAGLIDIYAPKMRIFLADTSDVNIPRLTPTIPVGYKFPEQLVSLKICQYRHGVYVDDLETELSRLIEAPYDFDIQFIDEDRRMLLYLVLPTTLSYGAMTFMPRQERIESFVRAKEYLADKVVDPSCLS